MGEITSYSEDLIIKIWERTFKEDWMRFGADFTEKKVATEKEKQEVVDMYKDLF